MSDRVSQAGPDPWVVAHNCIVFDGSISMAARLLYLAYKQHAWSGNTCFPSRKRLAEMVGCSIRTIDAANNELEERKLITRTARTKDNGSPTTSEITLHVPHQTPAQNLHGVVQNLQEGSAKSAHEIEHIELDVSNTTPHVLGVQSSGSQEPSGEERARYYVAFYRTRFIGSGRPAPSAIRTNQPDIDHLIREGYTPEQVETATQAAMKRFSSAAMVTFGSVVRNMRRLLEPEARTTREAKREENDSKAVERLRKTALSGDAWSFMMLPLRDQRRVFWALRNDQREAVLEGFPRETRETIIAFDGVALDSPDWEFADDPNYRPRRDVGLIYIQ